MREEIKFSIITVTYNCEKTIQRTMNSVLSQKYNDFEYIIIDGESTDGTTDIIEKNIEKATDDRVRYISEPDKGVYDAMNKGLKLAKGDIIGIINGDDYYVENALSVVAEKFCDESVDIIYSDLLYTSNGMVNNSHLIKADHEKLFRRMSVNHPTCFVRSSVYKRYEIFDTSYKIAADYDLMVRFLVNGCKFLKSEKVIAIMETGGLSSNNWNSIKEKYRIHTNYFGSKHAHFQRARNIILYFFRNIREVYRKHR